LQLQLVGVAFALLARDPASCRVRGREVGESRSVSVDDRWGLPRIDWNLDQLRIGGPHLRLGLGEN
jgi:hypothetical protein